MNELVADIISELTRLEGKQFPFGDEGDSFPFPGMISTGNGGSILVSRKIEKLIAKVALRLFENDQSLRLTNTRAEWRTAVRKSFGPALIKINLDNDPKVNAVIVLNDVKSTLAAQALSNDAREHAFGCTLFSKVDVKAFSIGPVTFETRLDWLQRNTLSGAVSEITSRRINRIWQGQKVSKRKPSFESICESGVVSAVGRCPYVCSVKISGFAHEAGKQKALTAARLALTSIALLWQTPSAALSGFNLLFDGSPQQQNLLTIVSGKNVLASSALSKLPHGHSFKLGEWEQAFAEGRDHFAVHGEMLEYILSSTGAVPRPKLMNTLTQALLWFHEGCRDKLDLMAVVQFSACLDTLAGGRKAPGIRQVINARLGMKDDAPIRVDGPTLKQSIEHLYSDGRSRTVHGTNEKFGHDWTETKALAERFASLCLRSCTEWAAKNPTSDDPEKLKK